MFLVVFDFDHTIIDANSDIHVNKLFPSDEDRLIAEENCSHFQCWTDRMQEIFRQLHKYNIKENDTGRKRKQFFLIRIAKFL
ncbi:unnamed protein product [Rotaria sp. Silwood1]|nr:unnamed protein product [Rotaria sp. Silwood1]CAF5007373.1 unnamed protein product [Rotaria sp. Silwood1]